MSRGPGRWQRLILDAVAEHGEVIVQAVVAGELRTALPPRAALVAAQRAARVLADAGKVTLGEAYLCPRGLHRPFIRYADRCECCSRYWYAPRRTISVAAGTTSPSNTYQHRRRSRARGSGSGPVTKTLSAEALAGIRAGEERFGGSTLEERSEHVAAFTRMLGGSS